MQLISNSKEHIFNREHLVKFSGVRQKWWKLMEILSVSSSLKTSGGAKPNTLKRGGVVENNKDKYKDKYKDKHEDKYEDK